MPRYLVPPKGSEPASANTASAAPKTRLGPADIAWLARASLDRRKLLLAFIGLMVSAVVFFILASLGNRAGSPLTRAILRYVGAALAYLVLAFTCLALARMVHFQARTGGVRTGVVETLRFCRGRLGALCLTPGGLVLTAIVAAAIMALLGFLGSIAPPVFGFLFLVKFALGVVIVAAGLILTWGLFLYPAILAAEEGDPLDTVRRYLDLYHKHGLSLAGYQVVALVLTWLAALVPGVVAILGLGCVRGIVGSTGVLRLSASRVPGVLREMVSGWLLAVGDSLGVLFPRFTDLAQGVAAVLLRVDPTNASRPFMYGMSGAFIGFSLLIIVAAALAYALVFFVAAGTRVYMAHAEPDTGDAAEQRAAA